MYKNIIGTCIFWCKFETKEEKTRTKRLVLRILTYNKNFQVKYGVQINSSYKRHSTRVKIEWPSQKTIYSNKVPKKETHEKGNYCVHDYDVHSSVFGDEHMKIPTAFK